jgi:hypothetical protein
MLYVPGDPFYPRDNPLTSEKIQEIGMGWYQWQLFIVVGFGWANDNLWPIVTSLIRSFSISHLFFKYDLTMPSYPRRQ